MTNENVALNSCFKEAREVAEKKRAEYEEITHVYLVVPAHSPNMVMRLVFKRKEDALDYAKHKAEGFQKYTGEPTSYTVVAVPFIIEGDITYRQHSA